MLLGADTALSMLYYDDDDPTRRNELATATWFIRALFCFVIIAFTGLNIYYLSVRLLGNASYQPFLLMVALTLPFSLSINLFSQLLRLRFSLLKYNMLSIGLLLLTVALNLYLVAYKRVGIMGVFWSDLGANSIFALVGFAYTRNNFKFALSPKLTKTLLAIGLPILPASLAGVILASVDRFFLLRYTSLYTVGVYAVGAKLGNIMGLITGAFQIAWYPFAFSIAKEENARNVYANVLRFFLIATLALALFLSNFSKEDVHFATTPAYLNAYQVVGILAVGQVVGQGYYILSIGLGVTKKTVYLSITQLIGLAITLLLDFVLVPRIGMVGAATAPLVGDLLSAVWAYQMAQRSFPVPFEWGKISKIVLISIVLMLIGTNLNTGRLVVNIALEVVITFACYPVLLYFTGCISKAEVGAIGKLIAQVRTTVGV